MFGGAAAGGQNNEEGKIEKTNETGCCSYSCNALTIPHQRSPIDSAEAQAKAMGMSVKEYQIAMRMRENLANGEGVCWRFTGDSTVVCPYKKIPNPTPTLLIIACSALNNHRSEKGDADCKVIHDGNCIVKSVTISDSKISEGKEKLEADLLKAWQDSFDDAKAATQREFQKLQKGVAEEMKGLWASQRGIWWIICVLFYFFKHLYMLFFTSLIIVQFLLLHTTIFYDG